MRENRQYRTYVYLAGIQVPFVTCSIASQHGSLANLNLELNYSPFITHIREFTKVQVWEQVIEINKPEDKPGPLTLQFDGIVVGIVRSKNVLGNVSVRLMCLTDGYIWNQRKRYDFYLDQITQADTRGIDSLINIKADGKIDNSINDLLQKNKFDAGAAIASILTAENFGIKTGENKEIENFEHTKFSYTYNGIKFEQVLKENSSQVPINPKYYDRFLSKYKLAQKMYGVTTSSDVKKYFHADRFIGLLNNLSNDIVGENSFWNIASMVGQYGFYSIFNIPDATYVPAAISSKQSVKLSDVPNSAENDSRSHLTVLASRQNGLAEYILKPISFIGTPFKCNVIWPEQVISESLFYDLVNAPTRVLMQSTPVPAGVTVPALGLDTVLTTRRIAGPNVGSGGFFSSFTPNANKKQIKEKPNDPKIRPSLIYSEYENEFGMRYFEVKPSHAFESNILKSKDINESTTKLNNFLNYEFAQRYFSSRNYSIQVTPDVDIVPGLPVIVLNKNKEHVICFCTGKTKTWDSRGNKTVGLSLSYPRFYYENIDSLGNMVDPSAKDVFHLQEMEVLFGSEALINPGGVPAENITSKILAEEINELYKNYDEYITGENKNFDISKYSRKVCTISEFCSLYGITIEDNTKPLNSYLKEQFSAISSSGNSLSNNIFYADAEDGQGFREFSGKTTEEIIDLHLNWISQGRRI